MDGEEKRSEQRAPGQSGGRRVGDKEQSAKMEKAWPVGGRITTAGLCKARGVFQGQRSDCLYPTLLLD